MHVDTTSLSPESIIDSLCDSWDRAWRDSAAPALQDYLDQVPDDLRPELFAELLRIELEWRCRRGESPQPSDYADVTPSGCELDSAWFQEAQEAARGFQTPVPASTRPSTTPPIQAASRSGVASHRFQILSLHAEGGLGRVSIARDQQLERNVALKEIRPDRLGGQAQQRFLCEARITGQLEHPGIIPVYALEMDDEMPRYAMRFVEGRTLRDAIRAYHAAPTPMAFTALLRRFVNVCQTIGYAHSRSIIHRDLKPQNIMIGDYGETLIIDWGLAKRIEPTTAPQQPTIDATLSTLEQNIELQDLTRCGQVVGTLAYMSPEQARGEIDRIGPATDIFSLGAILYEILTQRPPYQFDRLIDLLQAAREGKPINARTIDHNVPAALAAIAQRAMAERPEHRYATAAELANEVERWLSDEPVSAYPDGVFQRLRRWSKRHRSIVMTFIGSLVAGVAVLGATLAQVNQARRDADERRQFAEGETKRANEQATIAQNRFSEALAAIQDVIASAERSLAKKPELAQTYREILQNAQGRVRRLLPDASEAGEADRVRCQIHLVLGNVERLLGNADNARREVNDALRLAERLEAEGADASIALMIGQVHLQIARIELTVRRMIPACESAERARTAFQRAEAKDFLAETDELLLLAALEAGDINRASGVSQRLAADGAMKINPDDRIDLAMSLITRGDQCENPAMQRQFWKFAVQQGKQCAVESPDNVIAWRVPSAGLQRLGRDAKEREQFGEAREYLNEGLAWIEEAKKRHPNDHRLHEGEGACLEYLAKINEVNNNDKLAIMQYRRSIEANRKALQLEPRSREAVYGIIEAMENLGFVIEKTDADETIRIWEEAYQLADSVTVPDTKMWKIRATLAQSLAQSAKARNQPQRCLEWADRALKASGRLPLDDSYDRFVHGISFEVRGDAYKLLNQPDAAREAWLKAHDHFMKAAQDISMPKVYRAPMYTFDALTVLEVQETNFDVAVQHLDAWQLYLKSLEDRYGYRLNANDEQQMRNLNALCRAFPRAIDDLDYLKGLPGDHRNRVMNYRCKYFLKRRQFDDFARAADAWADPEQLQIWNSFHAATAYASAIEVLMEKDPRREAFARRVVELLRQEAAVDGFLSDWNSNDPAERYIWDEPAFRALYHRADWHAFIWDLAETPLRRK